MIGKRAVMKINEVDISTLGHMVEKNVVQVKIITEGKTPLIILSSLLSDNLFTDKALVILYNLESRKKIQLISLLDTGATNIAFINKVVICTICEALEISFIRLTKPNHSKDLMVNQFCQSHISYILY